MLLENYFLPGDLNDSIEWFVTHYNHHRYHESLSNLTPADVYFGCGETILLERERTKRNTIKQQMSQALHYIKQPSVPKTLTTDKYDATAKLVNEEIAALGDDGTFADLKLIDKKLGLPRGSSFEMGGFSDYFAFVETDDD